MRDSFFLLNFSGDITNVPLNTSITMANIVQRACFSIPEFEQRYEKFSKELQVRQYSPGSISAYCHKLSAICLHFRKLPESLTEDDCRDYFSMLLSRSPSPGLSYFKHTVYSLRCYRKMMGLSSFTVPLPSIRKDKKLPIVLSQEEIRRLLSVTSSIRGKAIFSLIYSCGLRMSELINLRLYQIDNDRMQVFVYQGKGKKDRYVPLSSNVQIVLKRYLEAYDPCMYLFNDSPGKPVTEQEVRYLFRDAVRTAGILKPCTLHTLRHSYATHLLEMGENILRIRDLLGHANIKTTMIYLHLASLPEGGKAFSPLDRLFPTGIQKSAE